MKRRVKWGRVAALLGALALSLVWLYPIVLIFLNSFKASNEIMSRFLQLPERFSLENYRVAWESFRFPRLLGNTLLYTGVSVLAISLFAPMAAYKLARTPGRLSNILFLILILPVMVPFQSYMITLTRLVAGTGLSGTRIGYIIVMTGMGTTFAAFMVHGFVKSIPRELEECAFLDGASSLRTYFSIVFPLLVPIVTTVLIINVLGTWNDITVNLLIMGGKEATMNLSNALFSRFASQASDWERALPGILMATLPNILFFAFMQRYIVEGITAGAVKG